MGVFVVVGILLILHVGYRLFRHIFPPPNINPNGKYVLITGCDSGFGHGLAIELDKQGFNVLAAILDPDNEERIKNHLSNRATVFILDITQQVDIDAAYDLVSQKTKSLHALVNNAGIGRGGLIEWTPMDLIREVMEVNFLGHVAMTKKFLPLLTSRRGSRIVNICSAAGYIAGPGMAAYSASKFALEAFSDSLRREMFSWGLHVSIIEPGFMRTPIIEGIEHRYRNLWSELDKSVRERWGENYFHQVLTNITKDPLILNAENPQKVIKALRHAVLNSVPRIRYRPGWQSSLFLFPLSMLPAWLGDWVMVTRREINVLPDGLQHQED